MSIGKLLTFNGDTRGYEGCLTIGKKYTVKEYGKIRGYEWVVIDDDHGDSWELGLESFKSLEEERQETLEKLGI